MKYLYLFIVLTILTSVGTAQKLQRAFAFGNSSDQYGRKIAYDSQGNMFVAGSFRGTNMDVDPSSATFNLNSNGDWDFFIAKYDPYGIFLNAIAVGGLDNDQATSLAVDDAGNVYITGWFRGTVDFNPSTGTNNVVSNGHTGNDMGYNGEVFLAKYSNDLSFSWAFGIGGSTINDAGLAVKIDNQSNVILAGNFCGNNVDFDPSSNVANLSAQGVIESFIAKYTAAGNYVWAKGIGGATTVSGQIRDMGIDNANNIFAVGHFDGAVDLNPGAAVNSVTSSGCGDIYLVKLSDAGAYKWGFKIGGASCDYPVNIVLDAQANAYISGYFSSSNVDFNPGPGTNTLSTTASSYDIFFAKYDSSGAYVFANRAGGTGADIGYDMAVRSDGIVVVGYFTRTVDFDPSSATNALTASASTPGSDSSDGFIAHYTFDGQYISAFKIGGNGQDAVYAVYADSNDVISVTGFFNHANVDFDPSAGKFYLSNTGTSSDVFVAKYFDLDVRNAVKGTVFLDKNANGTKESDEPYYPGVKLVSIKQGEDTVVTVSSNGRFTFAIDTGQYITRPVLFAPYYTTVPGSDTTNFSTYMNSDSISFAVQPIPGIKDLAITAIPLTPARPGFKVKYQLLYGNKGTDSILASTIQFIRNSKLNFDSASVTPSSINGDTLTWNLTNLAPRSFGTILIHLKAQNPPTVSIGDTLISTATIYPVTGDTTAVDNVFTVKQIAIGSYDPNDKREAHGGRITPTQVSEGEYLQYTIRFQNTGTDTAFNINIRDTLSTKLDWNSFEMVSSSHEYQLTINDGNKCLWTFSDINLVDSNKNEPLSHGYIVFRIKPVSTLVIGDVITNRASIYFDFNLPVETNTEQTIVQIPSVLPLRMLEFSARRAGKANELNWVAVNEVNVSHHEIQRSGDGHDFTAIGTVTAQTGTGEKHYSFTDVLPLKATNYYRLKIVDKDGKIQFSPIRKVENRLNLFVEASPNPVSDKLVVRVSSENAKQVQLEVIDINGRTFSRQNVSLNNGYRTVELNIAYLSSGSYFIRVSAGEEQLTQKFIKL